MLSVYSNTQDLLNTTGTTEAKRFENVDLSLLDTRKFAVTFRAEKKPNLELHVYTPDGAYLYGNHSTTYSTEDNTVGSQLNAYEHLVVDTRNELELLGVSRGTYKLVYNLFDNIIGKFDGEKLWIKEISPSRREVRIQLPGNSTTLLSQLENFRNRWASYTENDIFDSFVLNFGFNETYQIINAKFIDFATSPEIIVRLYNPLPAQYGEKSRLWISEEIIQPVLDTVTIVPAAPVQPVTNLAPPNFELEEYEGHSVATSFKTWNDLLSQNLQTSQQLIDAQFSGSLSGIKLNVNYRNFENFVHFSSAVERVKNFKYKVELIEYYNSRIRIVSGVNGGDVTGNNLTDLFTRRSQVVSGFDDFEKYLFFESTGSNLYSHYGSATGSIEPWPKINGDNLTWQTAWSTWSTYSSTWLASGSPDPYGYFSRLSLSTSEEAEVYYADLLELAEIYDRSNIHRLVNTVPGHITDSTQNEDFVLFVNMLGQHFDILWSYIKNLTSLKVREEHPADGMPGDLLYHIAESMGFKLLNGKSASELWKYSLGTDASGSALQTNVGGITSISDSNHTKEIWRRIVNNLPYILKTKGTSRSIKALLTCFGIPSSVLTIKEFGGPTTFTDIDHFPEYTHDVFHYAWLSTTGSLLIQSQSYINGTGNTVYPDTLEFRFKTDNNFSYVVNSPYTIFHTSGSSLTLTKETADDNEGTLTLTINGKSGSIGNLEVFDNSWHQVVVETTNGSGSLRVARSLYGNLIYLHSASFATGSGLSTLRENIHFASGSNKLFGHFQEIRLWSGSLTSETITEHAASPNTYTFNVDRFALATGEEANYPYNHLLQRFTLSENKVRSGSFYQTSVHPNQRINNGSIYFIGYDTSGSIHFEGFEETYYTPSPSLGASTLFTSKVRIESSSLDPNLRLNTQTRIERSSFDRYSRDSNKLGIYFSPQTAINEDIFNHLGYFEIDDYIGNPEDLYNDYYTDLNAFAANYWKKYDNRNDFESYFRALQIYDFTLFKYIKKLLPQRVNLLSGIVVEPNVLERNKVKLLNKPTIEDLKKDAVIDANLFVEPIAEYTSIVAVIDDISPDLSAEHHFLESTIGNMLPDLITDYFPDLRASITGSVPDIESEYMALNSEINNIIEIDRLGSNWVQNRRVGRYKITESGSFSPIQTLVTNSRISAQLIDSANPLRLYTYLPNSTRSIIETSTWTFSDLPANRYTVIGTINSWVGNDPAAEFIINGAPGGITAFSILSSSISTFPYEFTASFTSPVNNIKVSAIDTTSGEISNLQVFVDNYSDVQPFQTGVTAPTGISNQRFNGSRLTGPGINVNTANTIDGGPVVRVTQVNPNRLVFANRQLTTIDQATVGLRRRSI